MSLVQFRPRTTPLPTTDTRMEALLDGFSIEVMPKTAAKVDDFRALLPAGTRVYIAHIDGTPIDDMVATAARLSAAGMTVMPHFPARSIADGATLAQWIDRYAGEAGVTQALVLGGGRAEPVGDFDTTMQLLETGLFDRAGFTHLHVAGHPEGNRDIDPDGGDRAVMAALHLKQAFRDRSDAQMAIATQFAFEADPIIAWADRLDRAGIDLPIHVGAAGPAKLQTLIKYAIACGVGPSFRVLQRRAKDVTKLVMPFEPTEFLTHLAAHRAACPGSNIAGVHLFPLGGIAQSAGWTRAHGGQSGRPASA